MALDLSGIVNENDFFSQHYVESLLERDIESVRELPLSWDRVRTAWQRGVRAWTESADRGHELSALAPVFENLGFSLKEESWVREVY